MVRGVFSHNSLMRKIGLDWLFAYADDTIWKQTMAETRNRDGQGLDALKALVGRANSSSDTRRRGAAPVDEWNPDRVGEMDLVIKADGSWHYRGSPINRQALIDLFATVLRKDANGEYSLVTPVERLKITVEDAPFIAVEMSASQGAQGQVLTFRTNVGDVVVANADHPLRFATDADGGLKPYLLVRGRLEALLSRAVVYELVALGETVEIDGQSMFAIRSKGVAFAMMRADELDRLS